MLIGDAWPPEHENIKRIRELLTGDQPASCHEASLRLGLARPLVDAVFRAELDQGRTPMPCKVCNGAGVVIIPVGGPSCRCCSGTGIS
jgi:hypothetical protein